jgi:HlyD family secretion protein
VRYEAQTVQNVVTYDAVVSVDNAELKLRPGMTANASFVVAVREDVLRVPTAALRFRPSGDLGRKAPPAKARPPRNPSGEGHPKKAAQAGPERARTAGRGESSARRSRRVRRNKQLMRRVFVLRRGAPVPVRVRTGISDGSNVEVLGGELRKGDVVIVGVEGEGDKDRSRPGRRRRPRIL